MKTNQIQIDFLDAKTIDNEFVLFERIITDRKSKYSVAGGMVKNREEVKQFLAKLKVNKKYAKATHNTWACRISKDGQIFDVKNDDGETGAGNVILRILQKEDFINLIVVVTRWYGGIKLHGDRFKHVQDATKYFLAKVSQK
jgi:putative IMPACT (imprinted ancient) family translation regulator